MNSSECIFNINKNNMQIELYFNNGIYSVKVSMVSDNLLKEFISTNICCMEVINKIKALSKESSEYEFKEVYQYIYELFIGKCNNPYCYSKDHQYKLFWNAVNNFKRLPTIKVSNLTLTGYKYIVALIQDSVDEYCVVALHGFGKQKKLDGYRTKDIVLINKINELTSNSSNEQFEAIIHKSII